MRSRRTRHLTTTAPRPSFGASFLSLRSDPAVGERHHAVGHSAIAALWVMTAVVVPSSRLTLLDRLQHEDAGRDVQGAGRLVAEQHVGPFGDARAIATRCCSPPDSCAGKWSSRWPRPTSASASSGVIGSRDDLGDQRDVLPGGQAGDQVVELEDEADVLAAVPRERALVRAVRSWPR